MNIVQWLYILVLVIFGVYSSITIYHALRFGFRGDATKPMTVIYLIISALIIYFSWKYVFGTEWALIF